MYEEGSLETRRLMLNMRFEAPFYVLVNNGVRIPKCQVVTELMSDFENKFTFGGGRGI